MRSKRQKKLRLGGRRSPCPTEDEVTTTAMDVVYLGDERASFPFI